MNVRARLRAELLACLKGKRPVRVLVIDTFRCGHVRKFNTWVDANGQARCKLCKRKKGAKK